MVCSARPAAIEYEANSFSRLEPGVGVSPIGSFVAVDGEDAILLRGEDAVDAGLERVLLEAQARRGRVAAGSAAAPGRRRVNLPCT